MLLGLLTSIEPDTAESEDQKMKDLILITKAEEKNGGNRKVLPY